MRRRRLLGNGVAISRHTDPLGKGYKSCEARSLCFFHDSLPMGFNGAFGAAKNVGNLLASMTARDEFEDFPFSRRQRRQQRAINV